LTALKNCRNGALRAFPDEIRTLCTEVATVMNALGLPADTHTLYQQVMQVIDATAENYSSMQQDIAKGRETEIAFITGYLLEQARQLNIPTPANSALYQAIMQQQIQQNGQD
ncbi:MAG: ketopantoate reductase family protein, partial [Plesiomonas sp.]